MFGELIDLVCSTISSCRRFKDQTAKLTDLHLFSVSSHIFKSDFSSIEQLEHKFSSQILFYYIIDFFFVCVNT